MVSVCVLISLFCLPQAESQAARGWQGARRDGHRRRHRGTSRKRRTNVIQSFRFFSLFDSFFLFAGICWTFRECSRASRPTAIWRALICFRCFVPSEFSICLSERDFAQCFFFAVRYVKAFSLFPLCSDAYSNFTAGLPQAKVKPNCCLFCFLFCSHVLIAQEHAEEVDLATTELINVSVSNLVAELIARMEEEARISSKSK